MKKFLLATILLCPLIGLFGQATSGYSRFGQVFARAPQGVTAQVVPYATVSVTTSASGVAATIYSDPGLTDQITPPVITADESGMYQYYIPMNYMVTETISSPNQGSFVIPNVGENTEETLNLANPGPIGRGSGAVPSSATFTSLIVQGTLTTGLTTAGVVVTNGSGVLSSSGKGLAGVGAAIPTGPPSSVTGDLVTFASTGGDIRDSGIQPSTLLTTGTSITASQMPALTGDATSTAGTAAMTVKGLNGVLLSGLATGLLKNTTSTGVPTIAAAGTDYQAPLASTSTTVNGQNCALGSSCTVMGSYGDSYLLTNYTNSTTSYTSVISLPSIPAGVTVIGRCVLNWKTASTSYGITLAAQASYTPTTLYVTSNLFNGNPGFSQGPQTVITSTTITQIDTTASALGTAASYPAYVDLLLVNGSNANVITLYAESQNAGNVNTIAAGSFCSWLP